MNLFHFWKTLFCFAWLPLYFGGDSSSTTQQTTNNYDQRKVITNTLDGGAVAGAIGLATKVSDNITALAGQVVNSATTSQIHAYDYADGLFDSALDFANNNDSRALNAYDRAATIASDALSTIKTNSLTTANTLQAAYADAKGTSDSQKQIMLAVLAVAAVIVVAVMNKG